MRVSICERCEYYERKKWSHAFSSSSGKTVGYTHAYGYCKKEKIRCSSVLICPKYAEENAKMIQEWR